MIYCMMLNVPFTNLAEGTIHSRWILQKVHVQSLNLIFEKEDEDIIFVPF